MSEDREATLELITATQVTDAKLFNAVKAENPLLAKLMMDKLKSFLNNDYFANIERQTVLMKFLEEQEDKETLQEVLTSIQDSELKDDYAAIIMEWTYHNNDMIKTYNLAQYDGSILSLSKQTPPPEFEKTETLNTENFVKAILQVTTDLLKDSGDDDGQEGQEGNPG